MVAQTSMSVREVVQDAVSSQGVVDVPVENCEDHFRVNVSELRDFEIDMIQRCLEDHEFSAYRFNDSGFRFLKVPVEE